jgi:hypothetical protein
VQYARRLLCSSSEPLNSRIGACCMHSVDERLRTVVITLRAGLYPAGVEIFLMATRGWEAGNLPPSNGEISVWFCDDHAMSME